MELKYVGAKPNVSAKGVSFDQSKPDRYTFLNAAVELLEALSFKATEDKKVYLYNISGKEHSGRELVELLQKHCAEPEKAFENIQEKTNALIEKYTKRSKRMTDFLQMNAELGLAISRSCVTTIFSM